MNSVRISGSLFHPVSCKDTRRHILYGDRMSFPDNDNDNDEEADVAVGRCVSGCETPVVASSDCSW